MGITLEIVEGPNPTRDESGWDHYAYSVRLHRGTRSMSAPWMQGMAITSPPSAEDVLASLMLDASGYENTTCYEEWASDYGYDEDSRTGERIYRQVETLTRKLRRFLGDDYAATVTEDAEDAARRLVNA